MTNFESIKTLDIDNLATLIMCPNESGMKAIECDHSDDKNCWQCCLEWLMEESEETPNAQNPTREHNP